jgi:hypothetical protein
VLDNAAASAILEGVSQTAFQYQEGLGPSNRGLGISVASQIRPASVERALPPADFDFELPSLKMLRRVGLLLRFLVAQDHDVEIAAKPHWNRAPAMQLL